MRKGIQKFILSLLVMIPVGAQASYVLLNQALEKNNFIKATLVMHESGDQLSQEELSNLKKVADAKMASLQQELLKNESILQKLARFAWIPVTGFQALKTFFASIGGLQGILNQYEQHRKHDIEKHQGKNATLLKLGLAYSIPTFLTSISLGAIVPTLAVYFAPRILGLIQAQTEEMRQLAYLQTLIDKQLISAK